MTIRNAITIILSAIILALPSLLHAKEYRFEKEKCAIVTPDSGWNEIEYPPGTMEKPALAIRSSDGLMAVTFLILPLPAGVNDLDSEAIADIEQGIREGNQGEHLVELTGKKMSVSNAPGYLVSTRYEGAAVKWGQSLFVVANGYNYIITVVSNGTQPAADKHLQAILNSFRLLAASGTATDQHDSRLVGTWKGTDKGKLGYISFDGDGYASIRMDGETLGGKSFDMNGVTAYMVYEVDSSASPASMDFVVKLKENDMEGGRMRGIYKFISKDKLMVRMSFDNPDRPEGFEPAGNPDTITLTRVKK